MPIAFRWLCQLRTAPYSYDLLDNFARRSPRSLTPGLGDLEPGQRFMSIFVLESFCADRELTLRLVRGRALFGELAITYTLRPYCEARTRLLVRLCVWQPRSRRLFALGDLMMMRKQLHNLSALAEADWRARSA